MILLTGGLGFLGCHLAHYLAKAGQELVLADRQISRIPPLLKPFVDHNVAISRCDVLEFNELFYLLKKYPVKSIIHLAALYNATGTLYQCLKVNIDGTINVLEASRIMKINRVTLLSSQSIYRRTPEKVHEEDEDLPLKSHHYISLTKKACEMIGEKYCQEHGLPIVTVRPSQLYGPLYMSGMNPLQKMVENSVAGTPTYLPEVDPDEGDTLTYVKDCARAIGVVHLAENLNFSIYNIADRYLKYAEMAETIKKVIPDAEINLGAGKKEKKKEPIYLNVKRLNKEFGFEPEFPFEEGIRDYVQWLRLENGV